MHQASKLFIKENNRPVQFWCMVSFHRSDNSNFLPLTGPTSSCVFIFLAVLIGSCLFNGMLFSFECGGFWRRDTEIALLKSADVRLPRGPAAKEMRRLLLEAMKN